MSLLGKPPIGGSVHIDTHDEVAECVP